MLPALGLGVKDAAGMLGVSRQALYAVLSGQTAVLPEAAVRLGKLRGNGPGPWLRMQQARDLWRAERDLAGVVAAIPTLHAA